MPKIINGHLVRFHLDSRLDRLKVNFDRVQVLQDNLLDRFNSEFAINFSNIKEVSSEK